MIVAISNATKKNNYFLKFLVVVVVLLLNSIRKIPRHVYACTERQTDRQRQTETEKT